MHESANIFGASESGFASQHSHRVLMVFIPKYGLLFFKETLPWIVLRMRIYEKQSGSKNPNITNKECYKRNYCMELYWNAFVNDIPFFLNNFNN